MSPHHLWDGIVFQYGTCYNTFVSRLVIAASIQSVYTRWFSVLSILSSLSPHCPYSAPFPFPPLLKTATLTVVGNLPTLGGEMLQYYADISTQGDGGMEGTRREHNAGCGQGDLVMRTFPFICGQTRFDSNGFQKDQIKDNSGKIGIDQEKHGRNTRTASHG